MDAIYKLWQSCYQLNPSPDKSGNNEQVGLVGMWLVLNVVIMWLVKVVGKEDDVMVCGRFVVSKEGEVVGMRSARN